MPLNEKTLALHELIGLKVKVVSTLSRPHRGIEGIVRDETANTLVVECGGKFKRIPKKNSVFEFYGKDGVYIGRIDGSKLLNRPENRTKRGIHRFK